MPVKAFPSQLYALCFSLELSLLYVVAFFQKNSLHNLASSKELAVAPDKYFPTNGKTECIAKPLSAQIIFAPLWSATYFSVSQVWNTSVHPWSSLERCAELFPITPLTQVSRRHILKYQNIVQLRPSFGVCENLQADS